MYRFAMTCDGAQASNPRLCGMLEPPAHVKFEEFAGWIAAALEEHGWIADGDKHFCPEHNPAMKGTEARVRSGTYTEIAPGVRVRIPPDVPMFELTIEIQRDVPAAVRTAVETLVKQRESDAGPGRYDYADQGQIDVLIGYVSNTIEAG